MCGIVGYVGKKEATKYLIEGLSKLEYRGYDSAGVAVVNDGKVSMVKRKGRLANLADVLKENPVKGTVGIGHTRWATHGEPSDINSHPHQSSKGDITVVHNGIIENYNELTKWLKEEGYTFKSATDTEVIPNLIHYFYKGDLLDAVIKATEKMEGSYAIGVVCSEEPEKIVAVRKDSPLIVGLGTEENFIASDIPAVLSYTRDVYLLEDKEYVVLTNDSVEVYNSEAKKVNKEVFKVTWNEDAAEKGGFEDFMLKEIYEQPKAVKNTLAGKIELGKEISLKDVSFTKEQLEGYDKIYIVACGTAYHAGLVGKTAIERLAKIQVEVDVASEFRYREPLITDRTLIIVVSQSGETADTLAVLREGKNKGARVLAITNVVGSSVAREANDVIYTLAGPEIAVASTKAYVTQLVAFYVLALYFASLRGTVSSEYIEDVKKELLEIPEKIEKVLENQDGIKKYAAENFNEQDIYFLGRGLDYAVALEASLKLKEISYIHSDAYAAGELKHGPIALIDKNVPVITLITQEKLKDKMISNVREVSTRGGNIFAVANEGDIEAKEVSDSIIYIPRIMDLLTSVISIVPLQLLSYYIAKNKGCDVDKPRNLAKSVTVE